MRMPDVDMIATTLQETGDAKITLLRGPLSPEGPAAIKVLLTAAADIGLRDEQVLLTMTADEARLQVLPTARRGS